MPDSNPLWIDAGLDESIGSATITASADDFTITAHGLANGDLVTFTTLSGGAVGVLVQGGVYHVVNVTADTFQVSTFKGGPPVQFSSDGSADVFRFRPVFDARALRRALSGLLQIGRTSGVDPVHSHPFGPREGILVPSGDVVGVSGTDWTTTDVVAVVYPAVSSQSGGYVVAHLAETAALDPADGSQDRIDALDLQVQDDFEDSTGFRRARIVYVAGTPGSGTRGTETPNSLELGRITVFSGGTPAPDPSTTAPHTVARGGIIPVADSGAYPIANRYAGMALWDRAIEALVVDTTGSGDWLNIASAQGFRLGETLLFPGSATAGAPVVTQFDPADFPGARAARVKCQGSGGSGGGAPATSTGEASAGTGAQAGGYAESWLTWAQIETEASGTGTVEITSASDTAGVSGADGQVGDASSFGSLVSAAGGQGGVATAAATSTASLSGAVSTQALNGDIEIQGGGGGHCLRFGDHPLGSHGGHGGNAQMGNGARGVGQNVAGGDGFDFGGGGGGSANDSGATAKEGGQGARGIVVVEIYY